ncbi:hypothetical protein L1049_002766 [Liquidambar formosana]|uniref:Uncharacterized protein n=1 Tax=Liquidambar formosana TaxID=63359 RepID=A0AAP0NKP9_LIQFO
MASHLTQGQLIIQNENLHVQHKKAVVDENKRLLKHLPRSMEGGWEVGKLLMTLQTSQPSIMKLLKEEEFAKGGV